MANTTKAVFVPTAANTAFASNIVQSLDALVARRKTWEATDYKKANEGLYMLLADSLSTFNAKFLIGEDNDRKALRLDLSARLKADGIKVQRNSTTLTMFVRFVFGSDRKRAHGYSYVLKAAISHGVTADILPAYIVEQGGIEEIKRLMVKKAEAIAKQQAVQAATAVVKEDVASNAIRPLAHVELHGLTGTYALLLAKPNAEGGVDIVGALSEVAESMVSAFILRMAKQKVESAAADKELGRQVQQEHSDMLAGSEEQQLMVVNG
jgi:hypothetical protein